MKKTVYISSIVTVLSFVAFLVTSVLSEDATAMDEPGLVSMVFFFSFFIGLIVFVVSGVVSIIKALIRPKAREAVEVDPHSSQPLSDEAVHQEVVVEAKTAVSPSETNRISTRIGTTPLRTLLGIVFGIMLLSALLIPLTAGVSILGGIILSFLVMAGGSIMLDGECPVCHSKDDAFPTAEASELGADHKVLKQFKRGTRKRLIQLRRNNWNIVSCGQCKNWIVVDKRTRTAVRGDSHNLPFVHQWRVVLPRLSFRVPEGCICCGRTPTEYVDLSTDNARGVSVSEGAGMAASLLGGSLAGKFASAIVDGVQEGTGTGPRSVSLKEIPVCDEHKRSVWLRMAGRSVYAVLPSFESKTRLEAAIRNKEIPSDDDGT